MTIHLDGRPLEPMRVFCIGQNYAAHIEELDNDRPDSPIIFTKPATSLVPPGGEIPFPAHGRLLHHEAEVVVLVGAAGRPSGRDDARRFVAGLSLGVDLTLRDVQNDLRARGRPWEASKAFDGSGPVGTFVPFAEDLDLSDIPFALYVNDEIRQEGNTSRMLFDIPALCAAIGRIWSLRPGDLVFTGTPAGVGPLHRGDHIVVESPRIGRFAWRIAPR
jgi:2-keto-4-pentenoate hydratase/2-oxohepta-3-ene-1,7-dioic acid hydratase in catechol pathway